MTKTAESRPRSSWLWKMGLMLIPGCGTGATATIQDYVHQPTADLHEQYDVSNPVYAPFTIGDVVLAPRFVALDHTTTAIKLIAASSSAAPITISNVKLSGQGGSSKVWAERHEVTLERAEGPAVYKGYATFGQLTDAEIEAMAGDAPLTLALDVSSGDAARSISFEITRKSRTYLKTR